MSVGIKRPNANKRSGKEPNPKKIKNTDTLENPGKNDGKKPRDKESVSGKPGKFSKPIKGINSAAAKDKENTDKKPRDNKKSFPGKKLPGKFSKAYNGKKPGETNESDSKEKTDWVKYKKEKKELKLKRKKTKQTFEVAVKIKQIYEKLKCKSTENKKELVEDLYKILKKNDCIKKIVMAHDTARIIQCMLKHASPDTRSMIAEELLPIIVDMSLSKYAHFCVLKMVKYGSREIRDKIIKSMYGNIVKLATHTVSTGIIDVIYLNWASPKQKAYMRQEFYGSVYKMSKDDTVKKLKDTYAYSPTMKSATLTAVKLTLEHAGNKKLVDNCLIHFILLEYLQECSEEARAEIITLFSPLIASLVTTSQGCKAAILCFWHSATKERRGIVKSLREHLKKIVCHEQGHHFILAILSTMDDTKAIKKIIFDNIYEDLESIVETQWGRKVIEWFVQPADKKCFHPHLINFLEEGVQHGKKDKMIRRKEILEQVQEPLARKMSENPAFWLKSGHLGITTAVILKNLDETNFSNSASSLASVICQPDWKVNVKDETEDELEKNDKIDEKTKAKIRFFTKGEEAPKVIEKMLGIEHSGLHIALKKIIKNDNERHTNSQQTFSSFIVNRLSKEVLDVWLALNRACFVLLNIYENCTDTTVQESLKELLSDHIASLKKQQHTGAKLLIDKLGLKK